MTGWVFAHPVWLGVGGSLLAICVAVAALEWERLRAVERPRLPLFMETWR